MARAKQLPLSLHQHVVDELGGRIVRGEFGPDAVLPVKDKAPWQKLMAPIWDQYSAKIPDSKALIAAIGAL